MAHRRRPRRAVVPETWFGRAFRQVSLYFFDPTAQILVPEPVFVPRGDQLATALIDGLLARPGAGLRRVVERSFVPPGLDVELSVPVSDDGRRRHPAERDAARMPRGRIELMMAQLAWTLRQDPAIDGAADLDRRRRRCRCPAGSAEFGVDGARSTTPPASRPARCSSACATAVLVSGDRRSARAGQRPARHAPTSGSRVVGVSLDGDQVAGGHAGRRPSLVGRSAAADGARSRDRRRAAPPTCCRPAWDFADRMWLVDRPAAVPRLSCVDGRPAACRSTCPGITGRR